MQHFEPCSCSETFDDTSAHSGSFGWHQSVPRSTKSSKDLFCCNERWGVGDLQYEWCLLPNPSQGLSGTVRGATKASAIDPLGAGGAQGFLEWGFGRLACSTKMAKPCNLGSCCLDSQDLRKPCPLSMPSLLHNPSLNLASAFSIQYCEWQALLQPSSKMA